LILQKKRAVPGRNGDCALEKSLGMPWEEIGKRLYFDLKSIWLYQIFDERTFFASSSLSHVQAQEEKQLSR